LRGLGRSRLDQSFYFNSFSKLPDNIDYGVLLRLDAERFVAERGEDDPIVAFLIAIAIGFAIGIAIPTAFMPSTRAKFMYLVTRWDRIADKWGAVRSWLADAVRQSYPIAYSAAQWVAYHGLPMAGKRYVQREDVENLAIVFAVLVEAAMLFTPYLTRRVLLFADRVAVNTTVKISTRFRFLRRPIVRNVFRGFLGSSIFFTMTIGGVMLGLGAIYFSSHPLSLSGIWEFVKTFGWQILLGLAWMLMWDIVFDVAVVVGGRIVRSISSRISRYIRERMGTTIGWTASRIIRNRVLSFIISGTVKFARYFSRLFHLIIAGIRAVGRKVYDYLARLKGFLANKLAWLKGAFLGFWENLKKVLEYYNLVYAVYFHKPVPIYFRIPNIWDLFFIAGWIRVPFYPIVVVHFTPLPFLAYTVPLVLEERGQIYLVVTIADDNVRSRINALISNLKGTELRALVDTLSRFQNVRKLVSRIVDNPVYKNGVISVSGAVAYEADIYIGGAKSVLEKFLGEVAGGELAEDLFILLSNLRFARASIAKYGRVYISAFPLMSSFEKQAMVLTFKQLHEVHFSALRGLNEALNQQLYNLRRKYVYALTEPLDESKIMRLVEVTDAKVVRDILSRLKDNPYRRVDLNNIYVIPLSYKRYISEEEIQDFTEWVEHTANIYEYSIHSAQQTFKKSILETVNRLLKNRVMKRLVKIIEWSYKNLARFIHKSEAPSFARWLMSGYYRNLLKTMVSVSLIEEMPTSFWFITQSGRYIIESFATADPNNPHATYVVAYPGVNAFLFTYTPGGPHSGIVISAAGTKYNPTNLVVIDVPTKEIFEVEKAYQIKATPKSFKRLLDLEKSMQVTVHVPYYIINPANPKYASINIYPSRIAHVKIISGSSFGPRGGVDLLVVPGRITRRGVVVSDLYPNIRFLFREALRDAYPEIIRNEILRRIRNLGSGQIWMYLDMGSHSWVMLTTAEWSIFELNLFISNIADLRGVLGFVYLPKSALLEGVAPENIDKIIRLPLHVDDYARTLRIPPEALSPDKIRKWFDATVKIPTVNFHPLRWFGPMAGGLPADYFSRRLVLLHREFNDKFGGDSRLATYEALSWLTPKYVYESIESVGWTPGYRSIGYAYANIMTGLVLYPRYSTMFNVVPSPTSVEWIERLAPIVYPGLPYVPLYGFTQLSPVTNISTMYDLYLYTKQYLVNFFLQWAPVTVGEEQFAKTWLTPRAFQEYADLYYRVNALLASVQPEAIAKTIPYQVVKNLLDAPPTPILSYDIPVAVALPQPGYTSSEAINFTSNVMADVKVERDVRSASILSASMGMRYHSAEAITAAAYGEQAERSEELDIVIGAAARLFEELYITRLTVPRELITAIVAPEVKLAPPFPTAARKFTYMLPRSIIKKFIFGVGFDSHERFASLLDILCYVTTGRWFYNFNELGRESLCDTIAEKIMRRLPFHAFLLGSQSVLLELATVWVTGANIMQIMFERWKKIGARIVEGAKKMFEFYIPELGQWARLSEDDFKEYLDSLVQLGYLKKKVVNGEEYYIYRGSPVAREEA